MAQMLLWYFLTSPEIWTVSSLAFVGTHVGLLCVGLVTNRMRMHVDELHAEFREFEHRQLLSHEAIQEVAHLDS